MYTLSYILRSSSTLVTLLLNSYIIGYKSNVTDSVLYLTYVIHSRPALISIMISTALKNQHAITLSKSRSWPPKQLFQTVNSCFGKRKKQLFWKNSCFEKKKKQLFWKNSCLRKRKKQLFCQKQLFRQKKRTAEQLFLKVFDRYRYFLFFLAAWCKQCFVLLYRI